MIAVRPTQTGAQTEKENTMRVIVCGSRGWHDRAAIQRRLAVLPEGTVIVVGYDPVKHRPRGADKITYHEALKLGLTVECHPAPWEEEGKRAGFLRNAQMAA